MIETTGSLFYLIMGIIILVVGLLAGGLINLVTYRAPIKLFHDWKEQATEFLKDYEEPDPYVKKIFSSKSVCPNCQKAISRWQHFPIIGYFVLEKHRKYCKFPEPASLRPMIINLFCALLSVLVLLRFAHLPIHLVAALIFTWGLLTLSIIDYDHQLILDSLVLPFLWLGLFINCYYIFIPIRSAIFGAIVGYLIVFFPSKIYEWVKKDAGIGMGDYKLAAAIGAWLGLFAVISTVITALIIVIILMIVRIVMKGYKDQKQIAFGPVLSIAAWLILVYQLNFLAFVMELVQRNT